MRLVASEVLEVQEKILRCRRSHGYDSCGQCSVRLHCYLLDEWLSVRRKNRYG